MTAAKRVLIVDNNAFVAGGYKAMLLKQGYDVVFEEGGMHAVDRMKEYKPDIVLLDLGMQDKDGFTVLRERMTDAEAKKIPVIVVSSMEKQNLREELGALGADDYIHKLDVEPRELVRRIERMIA